MQNKKNWKTTLLGIIFGALTIAVPIITKQPIDAQTVINAAGFIGVGAAAKDHDTTGV